MSRLKRLCLAELLLLAAVPIGLAHDVDHVLVWAANGQHSVPDPQTVAGARRSA